MPAESPAYQQTDYKNMCLLWTVSNSSPERELKMTNQAEREQAIFLYSDLPCPLSAIRSWRRGWSSSASVMAFPVLAPLRPAGSPYRSSESSATCWRSATAKRFKWSLSGPRGSASRPSCVSKRPGATRSPRTRTWSTWSARPTTARRTRRRGARGRGAGCATAPRPTQTAAMWCAAAGVTTRTTTRACGSATASSTGAASSSATRAVRNQRFSPASREERDGQRLRMGNRQGAEGQGDTTRWNLKWRTWKYLFNILHILTSYLEFFKKRKDTREMEHEVRRACPKGVTWSEHALQVRGFNLLFPREKQHLAKHVTYRHRARVREKQQGLLLDVEKSGYTLTGSKVLWGDPAPDEYWKGGGGIF